MAGDSDTEQLWGTLPGATPAEDAVWAANMPPVDAVRNTTRQWAELAYWFPSTTAAVGVTPTIGWWEAPTGRFVPCDALFAAAFSVVVHFWIRRFVSWP